jgi:hypothetical protein
VVISGGRGGGVIKLLVNKTLHIDGTLTVNGEQRNTYTGGGSGGSIWIDTYNIKVV